MTRILIATGPLILLASLLWPWLPKLGLGRLSGDIMIERGNFKFYAPITTRIPLSILLRLGGWLL
ncbi:MAG: DUF2905 domain-containing protein [Bacteroidota bacterium]